MNSKDLWKRLMVGLDKDQRIVFPEIYLDNKDMYDKICGIAYLIYSDDGLDWVWEAGLERVRNAGAEVLTKVYVVRIRLPWNAAEGDWWVDHEELNSNREEYEILEVQIRATPKNKPYEVKIMEPLEFEMNREEYIVVDAKYLVCWRAEPDDVKDMEKIHDYHSVLSK